MAVKMVSLMAVCWVVYAAGWTVKLMAGWTGLLGWRMVLLLVLSAVLWAVQWELWVYKMVDKMDANSDAKME